MKAFATHIEMKFANGSNAYHREWCYGALTYSNLGSVTLTKIFGIGVYKRVGNRRSCLGVQWAMAE